MDSLQHRTGEKRGSMTANLTEHLAAERDRVGTAWGRLNRWRLQTILESAGQTILDLGCSRGDYVIELRKRGYSAFGFDLLVADEWRQSAVSYFSIADATALPLSDEAFDTILMFEVLEHLSEPQRALIEVHRVARQNIIVSVPNCTTDAAMRDAGLAFHHWVDRTHVQVFTADSLVNLLCDNGFLVQELKQINPVCPESLVLSSWRFPAKAARAVSKLMSRMPLRKRYYMTLLAVAVKR